MRVVSWLRDKVAQMQAAVGTIIGLIVIVIILPVVAKMSILGSSASAGLISMQTTIIDFTPLYGVGIAIALLGAFGLYRATS